MFDSRSRLPWRILAGVALSLALGLAIHQLEPTPYRIPIPISIFLLAVVLAAYWGGVGGGLAAAAASVVSAALALSEEGQLFRYDRDGEIRLAVLVVVAPLLAWFVGRQFTRRHESERALRFQKNLVEGLDAIVWEGDPATRTLSFVSAGAERLGYPLSDWLAPHFWSDHIHPDDRSGATEACEQTLAGTGRLTLEYRLVAADGRAVWIRDVRQVVFDGAGRPIRAHGVMIDISDTRKVDAEMRHALSLLGATLDSTEDGILVVDRDGKITSHNRKFLKIWGIPESVMASGQDDRAIAFVLDQLEDPGQFQERIRALYEQPEAESYDVLRFKDGRVIERYSMPHRLGESIIGRVWSFRDVTERYRGEDALRQKEQQLQHAQKMEAIGRLAGGVAHDFNNLLTAILGNSTLIREQLAPGDPLRVQIEEIEHAALRAATLTRQLLAFSRKQVFELRPVDVNAVVTGAARLVQRAIGEDVEVASNLAAEPCPVMADEGQLEQVILNLLLNARDAMPRGGTVTIGTAVLELPGGVPWARDPLPAGRYVRLSVIDTGVGMDEATKARIFEPFFTTKDYGKGTGLGLSTAYGIVRQLAGSIQVTSRSGRGSEFRIFLPWTAAEIPARATPEAAAAPARGSETILLVEDEPMVRSLVCERLARRGYRVLEAHDGPHALRVSRAHAGRVDLLVTDVVMPGMSGHDLAQQLMRERPGLGVLYVSGHSDDVLGPHRASIPEAIFVTKPFVLDTLERKVREVIAEREGGA